MIMLKHLFTFQIFFLLCVSSGLNAQLVIHHSAEGITQTEYQYNGLRDTIFLFSGSNPDKYLQAVSPNDSLTTFDWYRYDPGSETFVFVRSDGDVLNSRQDIDASAGYRLVVSGHGNNITSEFWAMINDFSVDIYNAEIVVEEGDTFKSVPTGQKWCHLIRDINSRIDSAELDYYDLNDGSSLELDNYYYVDDWRADPEASESGINDWFWNDDFGLRIDIEYPNWEDSWYIITVKDAFDFIAKDSVFYESIEPHADFTYQYITLDNAQYYPDRSESYYEDYYNSSDYDHISAPAQFLFNNLSINADTMIWSFDDGIREKTGVDSLLHTYEMPGEYSPKLTVYNVVPHLYEVCPDTFPKYNEQVVLEGDAEYPVVVDNARVDQDETGWIYNVITIPPDDGINDYFRFTGDVSITDFEIVIYNRYGNRVHKFKGNIRDWDGWDGTDDNTDRYVNSGVYFYVVKELFVLPMDEEGRKPKLISGSSTTTTDTESEIKPNNVYRGFIHVFNHGE